MRKFLLGATLAILLMVTAVMANSGGIDCSDPELPENVTIDIFRSFDDSYFDVTVTNGGNLNGTYDGYCIDLDLGASSGDTYIADVFTINSLPAGTVEYPDNLSLVNYIINKSYVGQPASCGGTYTYGDVQRSIWTLLEDNSQVGYNVGPSEQCRVDEILADAKANGGDFEPGCNDQFLIILVPYELVDSQLEPRQLMIIWVPCVCEEDGPGTGTPGYWKNHPEAWPVDNITIGGVTYSKDEAIDIMGMPEKGDKTFTMFRALVAAKLNVLVGNDDSCISATINEADDWMATYGPVSSGDKVKGNSDAWDEGEPLYEALDNYNNGLLPCAPSRDTLEEEEEELEE